MRIKYVIMSLLFFIVYSIGFSLDFGPLGFDKRIDNGEGYGQFSLRNHSNEPIRYKIKIKNSGKENNVSQYVSVYPRILTIPPQGEKFFKIYVEPPKNIKHGLYNFMLSMQEVGIPYLGETKENKSKPEIAMSAGVCLEMECYAGEVKKNFNIENGVFYINQNNQKCYKAVVKNETGRGYEIGVGFYDSNNNLMNVKAYGRLENNNSMKIDLEIPNGAKSIVFYDYNNLIVVGQQIKIN
ncbi:MAG: hypothetical protein ACRC1R_02625 [Cetobacterium sp.]|uniref:hypothetical protein n=1 Tax=Cetobacterium sp. TaxID=2071632 RepID=UPI003F2B5DD7